MGIYSSRLSCWQRHKNGLVQDHAGPITIDDEVKQLVEETVEEVNTIVEDKEAEDIEYLQEQLCDTIKTSDSEEDIKPNKSAKKRGGRK